ncbi:L-ribulose-5-phosphate 4-epimerase AraD [Staphylococcus succinus]|uniref:L-ribulose-5-phosphate 4-epimerase n=1 Tax=Staphylococcus TaxID=1279 RepID=UPI00062B9F0A|nr:MULTISPECIES: L-ribulose-5-phosphate 4-epimerase [Staphylococcus]MDH9161625.1 L-ribulose-5-phosphate 4-epimerase [Staphylococcus succinus]MEB8123687.1 L-ribulose-5-phosphate 4-epimerase [Staphylococcus succinus]OIJ31271.1 L-ribulose-5-phosphate 4-epimerase [Staphylococcus sp. LCT-H4]PKI21404.1 L-ribulose-5-phosphate 4-epimerase AraD [Staphylococcus succinus]PNZ21675.1 L-ribulose-5-phosphate 4-epimerase AraD [Staphylococcus succinus subsp. succinus]
MLEKLKQEVYQANLELPQRGLIKYTWGNVSGFDEATQLFVIKPSGVDYDEMSADDMVVCNLNCEVVEGNLNPSSDMPTHAVLYKSFEGIGSVVHTHSPWATVWAQAGMDVPAMGTTHADTFYGAVPCARFLTAEEVNSNYEYETGKLIVETFEDKNIKPNEVPAVLLQGHAPFVWAKDCAHAVMNAVVLEEVCKMNLFSKQLNQEAPALPQEILDKHYERKHGKNAYYGQN